MKRKPKGKGRRGRAKRQSDGPVLVEHPMSGVDPTALKSALSQIAVRQVADFPVILGRIEATLRRVSPIHLAAMIIGWGMIGPVGPEGTGETLIRGIDQHHLEILLALVLVVPFKDWGERPPVPEDVEKTVNDLKELAEAFHQRRYDQLSQERSREQQVILSLQEKLRLHTQVVRNWGYESDVRRISASLFGPLDDALRKRHGFSASDLIEVVTALEKIIQRRLNERLRVLRKVFAQKTVRQCVRIYYRDYPGVEGDAEQFLSKIAKHVSLDAVRFMLLAHADLSLATLMLVRVDEVARLATSIEPKTIRLVLDKLSKEPGALSDISPDFLFMDNPIWTAPGIKMGDDSYFTPMPQVVFSFVFLVFRQLCDTQELKAALEIRRAKFLEAETEATVRSAFPGATVCPGAKWSLDGEQFEADVLVFCDRTLLIFEAKSAALTPQALRGAPDRVKRHVNDLIVAPAVQSARLMQTIKDAVRGHRGSAVALAHLPFDPKAIDQIARVSVTLDDFSILATNEAELREAGWVPSDVEPAPTLNLADLQVITDILEEPLFIIDYLIERERLQKSVLVFGDELDHLGLYLETAFNFGEVEEQKPSLILTGMSGPIDRYYTSRDAGVVIRKPGVKLHPYFRQLLNMLQSRARPGWTTIGRALLHLGNLHEQRKIVGALEVARRTVTREFRETGHKSTVVIRPPAPRDTLGLFHIYTNRSPNDPKDASSQIAAEAMEESGLRCCVTVLRSVEDWNSPYRAVAIMQA